MAQIVTADEVEQHRESLGLPKRSKGATPSDPLAWTNLFTISDEEAAMIADPEFLYPGLIVRGHLIVIAAKPNGGKTTIALKLSGDIVKAGYHVIYVNGDIAGGDAKAFREKANRYGIVPLFPDMKPGYSMQHINKHLIEMNSQPVDLSSTVFVFDTLKKMVDVIQKKSLKGLLNLLRGLTAKGATIILLAHTNKYEDHEGKPVFEGTGDLRSDVDELLYLIPQKEFDGSITVSVEPDKTRAKIEKMTFKITPERDVIRLDNFVDVVDKKARQVRLEKDGDVIERILEAIEASKHKQCEIVEYCKEHSISRQKVLACLKRYSHGPDRKWLAEKQFQKNAWRYYLKDE